MLFNPRELSFSHCSELIEQGVEELARALPVPPPNPRFAATSWAFLILAWKHLIENGSLDTAQFRLGATDRGDDQSIDAVNIKVGAHKRLTITVLQTKNQDTFSDTEVRLFDGGLRYLFTEPPAAYRALTNTKLVSAIERVRRAMRRGRAHVRVLYVSKADVGAVHPNVHREIRRLQGSWQEHPQFGSFTVELIGAQDLVARKLDSDYHIPEDRVRLPILHKSGTPAYIQYIAPTTRKKAFAVTVKARDLAGFVQGRENWIFKENLRVYLQRNSGSINQKIFDSCTDQRDAEFFWLLNNGVTITCDDCHYVAGGRAEMQIRRPQIVNGCQTSMTLRAALASGALKPTAHLLVRVLELSDRALIDKITEATNSQTKIGLRDLRSNDDLQRTLKVAFRRYGLYYETKPKEFYALTREARRNIISNEKCGQACLAIRFRRPSVALARKSEIWNDGEPGYQRIFGCTANQLRRDYAIWQYCLERRTTLLRGRSGTSADARNELNVAAVKYGHFHVARILAQLLGGDDAVLDAASRRTQQAHRRALGILKDVLRERRRARRRLFVDWFAELKSGETDRAIERRLASPATR